MKKIFALATVFIALGLTSCKKDELSTSTITTSNVTTTVSAGTWRVTYYWDTNRDETANFNGFNFTFAASNLVSASNSLLTINGTWSIANDDSKIKLILAFTTNANFIEISDDWHVIERTDTKIRLQDVSGGNGGTDYLTFEKN
jgi:hypothetical protein